MSDAKPYTSEDLRSWMDDRTVATVRVLEEAQDLYRETEERLAKERTSHDQTEARAEKAEAELARRDEALRLCVEALEAEGKHSAPLDPDSECDGFWVGEAGHHGGRCPNCSVVLAAARALVKP